MTEIFRPPFFQPDSINGVPLAGALLYFYVAGTTTPITVYQDSGLITPHASPVVADASGIFPAIYVNTTTYKIVLQTSAGVTVKTYDNINTTSSSTSVLDSTFIIQNAGDQTKQAQFSASGITTGTTRTYTFPDVNGTIQVGNPSLLSNDAFYNLSLVASVATSALTVAIKGADGNDPSAANPVVINFRSATAASGAVAQLTLTAATSIVVSSGSTLGSTSAIATTYAIVVFNDAGTARMGIINPLLLPLVDTIGSSTAEGGSGGADSAGVFYTGIAATSKAYTVIGFITATEATAGTWATAPSAVQVGPAPAVADALPYVTPFVAYTPTFTGYGTAASISMWSRRVGDTLEVRGKFTCGTATGAEARISLGFNGTDGNVTASATKVASIQLAGDIIANVASAYTLYALIESAVGYLTLGVQSSALSALTKQNANVVFVAGNVISIEASVPISGW